MTSSGGEVLHHTVHTLGQDAATEWIPRNDTTPMPATMLAARNVRIAASPLHIGTRHDFDCANHQRLVVPPTPLTLRGTSDERLVHLDRVQLTH